MTTRAGHPATSRFAVLLLVACVLAACASSTSPSAAAPTPTGSTLNSAPSPASPSPAASPSPSPEPTAPDICAAQVLASLSESQRIGQLFIIGLIHNQLDATERDAIAQFHFGSVTFTEKTTIGVHPIRAVTDAVQTLATPEATGGVGFLIAANQEGGRIQALAGPGFDVIPSALIQGTLAPALLQAKAMRWGRQLWLAGVNLDFAPVADVVPPGTDDQNAPIGQLQREFGHDPATVSNHVAAFIAGMQASGIATTVKHYPGLGRVEGNTDFTDEVNDSVTTRNDPFLEPFRTAIRARVPFVMVSLATYERIDPAHLAVFSPAIVSGMLRGDMAFRGVVMSDALGAEAVASIPPATRAIHFLDVGGDLIISNGSHTAIEMATALASAAGESTRFLERVDNAALHVLRAKEALGLLPCGG
jgi:beta-N-acetylhexosaminidase